MCWTLYYMLTEHIFLFIAGSSFGDGYESLVHFTFKQYEAYQS